MAQVTSTYWLLHSGLNIVCDPKDKNSIIAIIEFTPFNQLSDADKDDLNFPSPILIFYQPCPVSFKNMGWIDVGYRMAEVL